MKQRYFIEIAYDGTNYFGWQIQPNHISVQERIQTVLSKLYNEPISIIGCGRTDTGVHAKQYFFHFDAPLERKKLKSSLKLMFPEDISLINIHKVAETAHARFDAIERSYTFHMHHKKNIFKRHYSLATDLKSLDMSKIQTACSVFEKEQNYLPLCKKNPSLEHHLSDVREVNFTLNEAKTEAIFEVRANRFLHNQIRRMVGALLNIGIGKLEVSELEEAMQNDGILKINDTVSAHALFLHSIKYPYICATNERQEKKHRL